MRYEIRDVIHGLIGRTPLEVDIINTSIFQRLRRINQLALANLVYPGAHHSRFEHSMGTMHIAGSIAEKLELSKKDITHIRLAALLHDIGHGPFSHVSEIMLEKYYNKNKVDIGKEREKIHELVTKDIIKNDDDLTRLLKHDVREKILTLLSKGDKKSFECDIVSGPLDADKLDYLLRDNYHTGVKYGMYDLDKMIESLVIIKFKETEETYLGIDEEGIYALEQLIMAKYHMTTQIYFHKIRGITDSMIIRGLELAIEEGIDEVRELYSYDGTKNFLKKYRKYHDANLINLIIEKNKALSSEIFNRLYERRLFKLIYSQNILDIGGGAQLKDKYAHLTDEEKGELENNIAEKLKVKREFVIIDIVDFKKPIGRPEGFSIEDNSILVNLKYKKPEKISDIPWSIFNFKGISETPELRVYAPNDDLTNLPKKQKEKEYKKLGENVRKIL